MIKKFKELSMNKSFRRHHKKFSELRRLWRKAKQGHWLNGKGIQQVSTLGWTTKILLNFNIKCQKKVLESKAQQSLLFWTTNSHQSNVKNCKKLWTLIQSCIEKFSSVEVSNLDWVKTILDWVKTNLDWVKTRAAIWTGSKTILDWV